MRDRLEIRVKDAFLLAAGFVISVTIAHRLGVEEVSQLKLLFRRKLGVLEQQHRVL